MLASECIAQKSVQGEYIFTRQELVSGFRFQENGTFDFFYSYGAADRSASGTFMVEGDTIKLRSKKEPGNDFRVNKQYKQGNGFIIKCDAPDPQLLPYMQCLVMNGKESSMYEAANDGIIKIDSDHCEKIYIRCLMFPDIPTLIKDERNTNNRFEVTLLAIVQEVSFKGIDLFIENDDSITCLPNYVFMMDDIRFIKR